MCINQPRVGYCNNNKSVATRNRGGKSCIINAVVVIAVVDDDGDLIFDIGFQFLEYSVSESETIEICLTTSFVAPSAVSADIVILGSSKQL